MNKEQKVQDLHVSQHSSNEMLSAAFPLNDANILIGDFMGKFDLPRAYCRSHGLPEYKPEEDLVEIKTFKYCSSWDWLMPAVNKFINGTIRPVESRDKNEYSKYCNELHNLVTDFTIVPVFNHLVKAIEWYGKIVAVGSR